MNIFMIAGGILFLFGVAQETILKPKAPIKKEESAIVIPKTTIEEPKVLPQE
jgi:hypothetical protein